MGRGNYNYNDLEKRVSKGLVLGLGNLRCSLFRSSLNSTSEYFVYVLDYFLTLFPVFTLSTNFPIIGITLRNNLESMVMGALPPTKGHRVEKYRRIIFPLLGTVFSVLAELTKIDTQKNGGGWIMASESNLRNAMNIQS